MPDVAMHQYAMRGERVAKGRELVVGRMAVDFRYSTADEQRQLGWGESRLGVVLDDGTVVFPAIDGAGKPRILVAVKGDGRGGTSPDAAKPTDWEAEVDSWGRTEPER
jgi:hypothetical protein